MIFQSRGTYAINGHISVKKYEIIKVTNSAAKILIEIVFYPETKLNKDDRKTNVLLYHTFVGLNRNKA